MAVTAGYQSWFRRQHPVGDTWVFHAGKSRADQGVLQLSRAGFVWKPKRGQSEPVSWHEVASVFESRSRLYRSSVVRFVLHDGREIQVTVGVVRRYEFDDAL